MATGWLCGQDAKSKPNAEIVTKLEEIVKIRERQAESVTLQYEMGQVPSTQLATANSQLAESRIALAEELGSKEDVVVYLLDLVKSQKMLHDRTKALFDDGRSTADDMRGIQASLLESEVRLLRAQEAE